MKHSKLFFLILLCVACKFYANNVLFRQGQSESRLISQERINGEEGINWTLFPPRIADIDERDLTLEEANDLFNDNIVFLHVPRHISLTQYLMQIGYILTVLNSMILSSVGINDSMISDLIGKNKN